ncbi:MAG: hypothetical protein Q8M03_05970 [Legionella sp.]|nr:hypothetical protein [Legionella sp.]
MKQHVIIVGAGLGGLYTACRLIREGVDAENIIIIDPRAGIYTRPGTLRHQLFSLVTEYTGIDTDAHSPVHHIKELERVMYTALIARNVQFVRETFVNLQPQTDTQIKAVITEQPDGNKSVYPADYVFDCTGVTGCVAKAVNEYQQQAGLDAYFKSAPLVDVNPIPDHLIAHVKVPGFSQVKSFPVTIIPTPYEFLHFKQCKPSRKIKEREQLRKLGWYYEAFPTFFIYPQSESDKSCLSMEVHLDLRTDKACLYMEAPPNLPKEKQSDWIRLLLAIYSNGLVKHFEELKPSQKYGKKPRILSFKTSLHQLNNAVFQSDELPPVIVGFDASTGFDYREGNGFGTGVARCNLMLTHFTIENGAIQSINKDAIEEALSTYINANCKEILNLLVAARQKAIENGYEYFSNIYAKVAKELPVEAIKRKQHQLTAGELAYQAANVQLIQFHSPNEPIKKLATLNKCLSYLIRAHLYLPLINEQAHQDIHSKLELVIEELRIKLDALKIESINQENYRKLKSKLTLIRKNFDKLGRAFVNRFLQNKIRELINEIPVNSDLEQADLPLKHRRSSRI